MRSHLNSHNQDAGTVIGRFAEYGVDLNGLIIPGRSIESVLASYAFNLVVNNDDETFKISLVGSATAVRYRGRELLLASQHQLRDVDETQVSMLTDSGRHVITSGGRRGYKPRSDTDAHDIIAFDFTEPCKDCPELKKRFFDFRQPPPDVLNVHVLGMLLTGYPSGAQKYEIHENNHLGIVRRQVVCLPHSQPSDDVLLTVKAVHPMAEDPDGMSGGSAFVIQWQHGQPHAYFAGVILRGGTSRFQILKAGVVLSFLESVFA